VSADDLAALRARMREDLLDAIAFACLGYNGPLGRWAARRVVEVWMRPEAAR